MHQIQKDKFHVISPEAFSPKPLNEVQKRLQAILDYWGPNGEKWCRGIWPDRACTASALAIVLNSGSIADTPEHACLARAAAETPYGWVIVCSDSGFENARKMVLRAIALAGEP